MRSLWFYRGYEPDWKQLLEWRVRLTRGRPAADRLLNYVSERREMRYCRKSWMEEMRKAAYPW